MVALPIGAHTMALNAEITDLPASGQVVSP